MDDDRTRIVARRDIEATQVLARPPQDHQDVQPTVLVPSVAPRPARRGTVWQRHRAKFFIALALLAALPLLWAFNRLANRTVPVLPPPTSISSALVSPAADSQQPSGQVTEVTASVVPATSATASSSAPTPSVTPSATPSVRPQLPADAKGTFTVRAKSPVTRKDYRLTCQADGLVTCTGSKSITVHVIK